VALSSFKIHVRRGHARLHFSDGQGRDLEGAALMPLVAFASDLVAEIARRKRGPLRGFSVDLGRGILRATVDASDGIEVVRIDGAEFESTVRPSSGALIEWAEHHFGSARMRD
jgi:hypothetical protein